MKERNAATWDVPEDGYYIFLLTEEDDNELGYDGPGWYFVLDGETEYNGPFGTRSYAEEAANRLA